MGERNAGSECWAWIKRWQNTLNSKNHLSMQVNWEDGLSWAHGSIKIIWYLLWSLGPQANLWLLEEWINILRKPLGWSNSMVCSLSGFCEEQVFYSLSASTPEALLCWDLSSYPWGSLAFHNSKVEASFCALVIRGARKKAKASAFSSGFP